MFAGTAGGGGSIASATVAVASDGPDDRLQHSSTVERQSGKDVEDRHEQVDVADVAEHGRERPDPVVDARRGPEQTAQREAGQRTEDRDREGRPRTSFLR